jgi:3-methyladenine DNA glycosylase/8-oxoguanine DNA glycosylase
MLQLHLPVDAFHAYCLEKPELKHAAEKKQGRVLRSPSVWEDLVKVILTTNTTWSQTISMTARLVDQWGSPLDPSDPLSSRSFPEPFQIAALSLDAFSALARTGYRASAIYELACKVTSGELDVERFASPELTDTELWKQLLALKGVGPYAASCMMIYLGHYSRVNVDSWARMMVGKELGKQVSDKEVHAFFAPYGKWQALAYHFYPWREAEPEY